jgi:hypothetical protein
MDYQDRPQFLNLMDMIDGGGAGRAGDRFEGGGLMSFLGNSMMRPAGYEERLRDRKNGTGRAITTAVQEMTGGAPNRSMRPKMREFTPQNLPNEVPMGAPMQDANRELVPPRFTHGPDLEQFLQDLRLKEQVYGLPPTPLDQATEMYRDYMNQRDGLESGQISIPGPRALAAPPMPNPLPGQVPKLPMPGY